MSLPCHEPGQRDHGFRTRRFEWTPPLSNTCSLFPSSLNTHHPTHPLMTSLRRFAFFEREALRAPALACLDLTAGTSGRCVQRVQAAVRGAAAGRRSAEGAQRLRVEMRAPRMIAKAGCAVARRGAACTHAQSSEHRIGTQARSAQARAQLAARTIAAYDAPSGPLPAPLVNPARRLCGAACMHSCGWVSRVSSLLCGAACAPAEFALRCHPARGTFSASSALISEICG